MATMRWNQRELDRLLHQPSGPVGQDLRRKAEAVKAEQKRLAPVSDDGSHGREPGYMRDSITDTYGRDGEGQYADIGPTAETPDGAPYPLFVELGTRPHAIRSKGDYPLRTADGTALGKEVEHPGTGATPFVRASLEVIRDE